MGSTSGRSWSWRARHTLLRAQRRSPPSLVRFALAVVNQMQRLEPFDRAMTLAAQAFTSIFPVVIVTFSLLPHDESGRLGGRVAQALALPENTRSALAGAFPEDAEQATTFGVLSLLIVLVSATSFSRALTRMYAKLWSVRGPGWSSPWRWIAVIVAIASCTVALQVAQRAASGSVRWLAGALLLTLAVNAVLWTWVPSVLLAAEVPWRLLAPGGLLTGVATVATYFASRVYMPSAMEYADRHFGELGVAFTSIGWLFAVAFVLIVASVVGAVVAREPGPASRFLARHTPQPAVASAPNDGPLIPHE
jgi:membrane protein